MSDEDGWTQEDSWPGIQMEQLREDNVALAAQNLKLIRILERHGIVPDDMPKQYAFFDTGLVERLLAAIQRNAYLRDDCRDVTDAAYAVRESRNPKL